MIRSTRTLLAATGALSFALAAPSVASAHGLGARSDLALPGWLFAWGAALVLGISFFALAALWQQPKLETATPRERFRIPAALEPVCGVVGVALFAALVYFGFAGEQDADQNVVPTFFWVLVWTVIPLLSAIFGDIFRPFNPWRAVGRGFAWLRAKRVHHSTPARFAYPEGLGRWPAAALLLFVGWLELVAGETGRDPSVMATVALAYALIQLVGMSLFSTERWLERGDGLGVYFNFFARMAPLTVQNGRLATRMPLSGLTDIPQLACTVAFVATMIGITVFDGAERGGLWAAVAGDDPTQFVASLGLIGGVLIVAGFYLLGVEGMKSSHIEKPAGELARIFAPSLVPIALGYVVAHYFSFVIFTGQALPHVIAHPLGDAGPPSVDYFVSGKVIWWVQVAALIAGHVAGLVVAHDKALAVWGKARAAAQSQMWMLVVMVGFTSLGLWLLSQSP